MRRRRSTTATPISIHAPPRGATRRHPPSCPTHTYFNSRPSARGDKTGKTSRTRQRHFNSRPSARGDGAWRVLGLLESHFNSRPSARGDGFSVRREVVVLLFQFTPLREGRQLTSQPTSTISYFNSRPSARGDPGGKCEIRPPAHFNSRPSARGDERMEKGVEKP